LVCKKYSLYPVDLTRKHFQQVVLQRGYELAEETFTCSLGHDDFMYAENKEQGYTEFQEVFYIIEHILAWYENGEINFVHFYGDTHECWTKPEDDS
jgi:hypothetical protein